MSCNEYDIICTPLVEHRIDTGDHHPIRQPLRRQPLAPQEIIDKQVEEMRRHGIIEPASSPWSSNVVLVRKRDGSLRFCVNYRAVSNVSIRIRIHCHVLTVVWMRYMELSGSQLWIYDLGITVYQFRCQIVISQRL